MLLAKETFLRYVSLGKYHVADGVKPSLAPCVNELLGARPSVEAKHDVVSFENAISLFHCRPEPKTISRVIAECASCAVTKTDEVRWISEDEIDALGRHLREDVDTVAVNHLVEKAILLHEHCGRGVHF